MSIDPAPAAPAHPLRSRTMRGSRRRSRARPLRPDLARAARSRRWRWDSSSSVPTASIWARRMPGWAWRPASRPGRWGRFSDTGPPTSGRARSCRAWLWPDWVRRAARIPRSVRWPAALAAILGGCILARGMYRSFGYRPAIWAGVCWFGCLAVIDRTGGAGLDMILGVATLAAIDRLLGRGATGPRDSGPRWRSSPVAGPHCS